MFRFFAGIGSEDAFRRMCVLDAIILNPDRHYGNFGVLFNTTTMELMGMAPVYDHNRSLFPELDSDQLSVPERHINRCWPRLGRDFILTTRRLLTDDIRRDLAQLKDFSFRQHPNIHAERERLDALSSIVQHRIERILGSRIL